MQPLRRGSAATPIPSSLCRPLASQSAWPGPPRQRAAPAPRPAPPPRARCRSPACWRCCAGSGSRTGGRCRTTWRTPWCECLPQGQVLGWGGAADPRLGLAAPDMAGSRVVTRLARDPSQGRLHARVRRGPRPQHARGQRPRQAFQPAPAARLRARRLGRGSRRGAGRLRRRRVCAAAGVGHHHRRGRRLLRGVPGVPGGCACRGRAGRLGCGCMVLAGGGRGGVSQPARRAEMLGARAAPPGEPAGLSSPAAPHAAMGVDCVAAMVKTNMDARGSVLPLDTVRRQM